MDASSSASSAPAEADVPLRRRLLQHAGVASRRGGARRTAHHLYGTIIVLAVLVTADSKDAEPLHAAVVLAVTVAVLLAMEAYAETIGHEIELQRTLTGAERLDALRELAGVTAAAEAPLVFLLLAAAHLLSVETAFALAEVTTVGSLFFYGYLARRQTGAGRRRSLLAGAVVAGIGLALAVGKGFVHV